MIILPRNIYNAAPPEPRSRLDNHPTLLFSWWCTGFAALTILFRLGGRLVRNDTLFREDKIMALSMIPLFIRMGLVHVILLYGTNNVQATDLSPLDIHHRSIGSRLVLASRIFYALFIWTAKFTISEFLKRMTCTFWKKSYEIQLRAIRMFLVISFFAVVVSTLAECKPFHHYWQVVPDPGPQCRQGYAQLITMGTADMITDLLLVIFPIPIVLKSVMRLKRKISLVLLFSMSIILFAIAAYRVPSVINHSGRQQYRTVWASGEILAAAAVSNAVILGSFLRDRGVKKAKYKRSSMSDSFDRNSSRRPTISQQQWGSDEDLIRDMGYRLSPEFSDSASLPRPAPIAIPASPTSTDRRPSFTEKPWQFPNEKTEASSRTSDDTLKPVGEEVVFQTPKRARLPSSKPSVSFFDVGGLLEDGSPTAMAPTPERRVSSQDFTPQRRGSRTLLSDLGGLLTPTKSARQPPISETDNTEASPPPSNAQRRRRSEAAPVGIANPTLQRVGNRQSLLDVGGLLRDSDAPLDRKPSNS